MAALCTAEARAMRMTIDVDQSMHPLSGWVEAVDQLYQFGGLIELIVLIEGVCQAGWDPPGTSASGCTADLSVGQ